MKHRKTALLFTMAMTFALAGCGQKAGQEQTTAATSAAEGEQQTQTAGEFSYPMQAGDALTYWCELQGTVSPNFSNLGETPFAKAWMQETGEIGRASCRERVSHQV